MDEVLNFDELEFLHVSRGEIITNFILICGLFSVLVIYHILLNFSLITTNLCGSYYSSVLRTRE